MGNKSTPILWWLIILILAVLLGIYLIRQDQTPKVQAVAPAPVTQCSLQSPNPRVRNGLISTPELYNNFSNTTGTCVIDNRASLLFREIPDYETLKSKYFDQSKSPRKDTITGDATQEQVESKIHNNDLDHLIYITGSLRIQNNGFLTGKPAIPIVIFVQNDLTINGNIDFAHTSSSGGLVFVVKRDVTIKKSVTQVDAVIISEGNIYTATDAIATTCTTNSVSVTNPLVINGSLISLDPTKQIRFCRKLANNAQAAEQINQQPKYLVILKDIVADTLQTWSEIP